MITAVSSEVRTVAFRTGGWILLFLGSCYRSDLTPAGTPLAVGAVGLFDTAQRIRSLFQSRIPRLDSAERKLGHTISSFSLRLPVNLLSMTKNELATYNANEDVKYSVEGGGRIGVSIDAKKLGVFQIQCTLRYLHEKHPQTSRA